MNQKRPIFSIVMPTYNSAKTIEASLRSVEMQDIGIENIELLVIDGGSTDETIEIAKMHGAVILYNPKKRPEYAKLIGFEAAKGKYLISMDSDEEFISASQLSNRYKAFSYFSEAKCLIVNRLLPVKGRGICGSYINYYGDPFTAFVYNRKGSTLVDFRRSTEREQNGAHLLCFSDSVLHPIGDGGTTTFDLDYIKTTFINEVKELSFVTACFDRTVDATGCCLCIKDDDVRHNTSATLKTYLAKLLFRVNNNLFNKSESGFSSREGNSEILKRKKLLFVLYAVTVVGPIFDSVRYSLRHKDAALLLHAFYLYYVLFCILFSVLFKSFRKASSNVAYGE